MTRTALVTGGTSGVGRGLVGDLVGAGYDVHFVGTSEEKGRSVEAELAGGPGTATFVRCDLGELHEVHQLAERVRTDLPRLDRLVCAAGVILPTEERTSEGLEKTFAVGCFGVFVLCRVLAPALAAADGARLLTVSGRPSLVLDRRTDLENLNATQGYRGMRTAIEAVHTKTVLTQVLSERLRHEGIDVNAFHPGPVRSDLARHLPGVLRWPVRLAMRMVPASSPTGTRACLSPELDGVSGQLLAGARALPLSFDRDYREAVWSRLEALVDGVL